MAQDYVRAHVYCELGAGRGSGEARAAREALVGNMRPGQAAEARAKAAGGWSAPEKAQEEAGAATAGVPEVVFIQGGCFQMGSPPSEAGRDEDERQHRVCVEDFHTGLGALRQPLRGRPGHPARRRPGLPSGQDALTLCSRPRDPLFWRL